LSGCLRDRRGVGTLALKRRFGGLKAQRHRSDPASGYLHPARSSRFLKASIANTLGRAVVRGLRPPLKTMWTNEWHRRGSRGRGFDPLLMDDVGGMLAPPRNCQGQRGYHVRSILREGKDG
jgi:hypothetical protein